MQGWRLACGAALRLPFGKAGGGVLAIQLVDDVKVVLALGALHDLVPWFNFDHVDTLHVLVIEGAPLLLALEQAVAVAFQCLDQRLAVQAVGALGGVGSLADDAVG